MHRIVSAFALSTALGFSAFSFADFTAPAFAQETQRKQRTLSLSASSEVRSAPDIAFISAGTVSEGKTAREALSANNAAMEKVLKTIEAAGIARKDIQTSNFSVQPRFKHYKRASDGSQRPPQIVGYTVSNTLTVIVRDLSKLGPIMDAVVSSGVNQMHGLNFSIAKPEPLRDEARKKAVAKVLARARLYAQAAGVTLGDIISISESGGARPPRPVARMAMEASAAGAAVPVAQGEQAITAHVNIVWEIR